MLPLGYLWDLASTRFKVLQRWTRTALGVATELGGKGGLARTGRPGDANHLKGRQAARTEIINLQNTSLLIKRKND
jgi:hypothetical protein